MSIQPKAVDRLGNVAYGDPRTITLAMPELGNLIENYADGDVITEAPRPEGTAVASQGIREITLRYERVDGTFGTVHAQPAGNPTRFHWTTADFPGWPTIWQLDTSYTLVASVQDTTGATTLSNPLTVILEGLPPSVAFTSLADGAVITATGRITVTGTTGDAASGVTAVRSSTDNGASWQLAALQGNTWSTTWDVPTLDGRTWHLVVEAADRAGLTARQRITVTVDNVLSAGLEGVTFNLPEGQHVQTGTALEVTWAAPGPESGVARVLAALDQITNTVPTQEMAGMSFQGTLEAFGNYYFHLLVEDASGNRLLYHYGPWHAWRLGPPPWPQYTIIADGWIDLAHNEWLPEYERLG